jgi:regulator of cell morphogenesis and NO signaling
MFNVQGKTVREIALEAPVTTRVFEEFKIDYCCHGNTQFDEACRNVGASPEKVLQKLAIVLDAPAGGAAANSTDMPASDLIDHILDKHHVYTKAEMQNLMPLMEKVVSRHGEHYDYLNQVKDLFQAVCDDLGPHMMKEEMVLFPYIQKLDHSIRHQLTASFPPFGTVSHPIGMMSVEHEEVGELLSKMRTITNDYTLPEGACPSFTALYHRLAEFELDIHQHIHLENNILFPQAIELERKAFEPVGH